MATSVKTTGANAVMMAQLKFTEDDLQANRAGTLSERQRDYLRTDRQKNLILGIGVVAGLVLGTAAMLFVGVQGGNLILQGLGVALMACNAFATYMFGTNWLRASYDLKTDTVTVVEGMAQHVVRQFGKAQAGSVRIGEVVEIPTKPDLFKAFAPNTTYRLYRTSHTKRLLSVEAVD